MRKLMITGAILALAPAAALAQDTYEQDTYETGQPEAEMSVTDTFSAMDTDMDGAVTQDEFTAYAGEGTEAQFEAAAGDDGELTEDELSSFVGAPDGMGDQ